MARTELGSGWTMIATTTADTEFQADGDWEYSTTDPSATGFEGGSLIKRRNSIVIGAGKTVYGYAREFLYGRDQAVYYQEIGA